MSSNSHPDDEPRFVVVEKPDPTDRRSQRTVFYVLDTAYDALSPYPAATRETAERSAAHFEHEDREGLIHALEWQAEIARNPESAL